jgi:hypothetical protein
MVSGFLGFAFLCVYSFASSAGIVEIAERMAPNFWTGTDINAPGLGANASLGMCLLPVLLFGELRQAPRHLVWPAALVVVVMFFCGTYVNVVLQNRTPFLALAASLAAGGAFFGYANRYNRAKLLKKFAQISLLLVSLVAYVAMTFDLSQFNIIFRFSEQRLESLRYQAWQTMLGSVQYSTLGGRVVRLGEDISYVHNLWLDVIWDAGLVPFIFLLAFHLKHVACFAAILRSGLSRAVILMIAGLAISFFANFMQEPSMTASVPFFPASCFFLGLVLRLTTETEHEGADERLLLPEVP